MKKFLLITLLCFVSTSIFAGYLAPAPIIGISESNFQYGLLQTTGLLQKCVADPICGLSSIEKDVANKIIALPMQKLIFLDGSQFTNSPAKSQFMDVVKAPDATTILINQTKLYANDQPLTALHAAAAILMLNAQAIGGPDMARVFTNKVLFYGGAVAGTLSMKPMGYVNKGVTFARLGAESILGFQDDVSLKNLTAAVEQRLHCPLQDQTPKFSGLDQQAWGGVDTNTSARITLLMKSRIHYQCLQARGVANFVGNLDSVFTIKLLAGSDIDFKNADPRVRFEWMNSAFEVTGVTPEVL
jgi:hypothetical protein